MQSGSTVKRQAFIIILGLVCEPALADGDDQRRVVQTFDGRQDGSNAAYLNVSANDRNNSIPAAPQGGIEQLVTNAANSLTSRNRPVEGTTQEMMGEQRARNTLNAPEHMINSQYDQVGENLTNVILAEEVTNVMQQFGPGGSQLVDNDLVIGTLSGQAVQSGDNTANMIQVETAIGTGVQNFPWDSVQRVDNSMRIDTVMPSDLGPVTVAQRETTSASDSAFRTTTPEVVQHGRNLGNIMIAEEILNVSRTFTGEQVVRNFLQVDPGNAPASVMQSGVNIANYASAYHVEGLKQDSNGTQIVENSVVDGSLNDIRDQIKNYTAVSENYVNVVEIRKPPSDDVNPAEGVSVSQTSSVGQSLTSSGGGTRLQVGNSASVQR